MSFFSQLASAVATNIVNSFTSSGTNDPLKVIEVSSSSYVARSIQRREQCLVVYGPGPGVGNDGYELVMVLLMTGNRDKVYSLCRSPDSALVVRHFEMAKEKLPVLSRISVDLCLLPRLQDLWSLLTTNPYWNAAHVIGHYGINDGLKDPSLLALLFVSDEATGITPVHVAAKNGKADFIKTIIATSSWTSVGFSTRDAKKNSIYHFAAQSNKETIEVLAFCELGDLFNSINEEGHTPLHVACQSDKPDCVKALIAAGANINMPSCFMEIDGRGIGHRRTDSGGNVSTNRTTITSTGNVTSAREILTAYPNTLHTKDMKNGGTPLHWCLTKEVVVALVELVDCCVDARNFCGQTALHVMVQRERFDCVVALLSRGGADPNLTDAVGNTPLHEALCGSGGNSSTNLLIVQALISFGADVNILNDQAESPRHLAARRSGSLASTILYALHAVGARRCNQNTGKCTDGCSPTGKDDGQWPAGEQMIPRSRHLFDSMLKSVCQHSAQVNQPGKSKSTIGGRVLCLDGGGIRGLVLIQLLQSLEQHLGGPIVEYFDWISGTSTGGILALAIASGKTIHECKKLYFRFKDQVFVGKRPYDADALEGFLRSEFGDKTMAELNSGPKVLVTAVSADTIPADLHFFRNYTSPQEMLSLPEFNGAGKGRNAGGNSNSGGQTKKAEEQQIWQAARASGAAPTYFRAFGSFLDGGLIANNPTLDVLTEIQEYGAVLNALGTVAPVQPTVVVSLGTGCKPAEQVDTLDLFRPESLLDTARLAFGVSAFGKLLVEQVTSCDRRVVDRARSWCTMIGAAYYRLSPSLTRDVALDETRHDQLVLMLWETQAYIHSHQADLKRIAQLLKY